MCVVSSPFSRVCVVGWREGALENVIDGYKFQSERASGAVLAALLDGVLPGVLPQDLVVMPIPTVAKNVRIRGFDHTKIIAKKLARKRQLPIITDLLKRTNNLTQHFLASTEDRRKNAEKSLVVNQNIKVPAKVLLVDDIYTTGATVEFAARLLRRYGVKEVWLGVVVRQPRR
jgi:ComF family protein